MSEGIRAIDVAAFIVQRFPGIEEQRLHLLTYYAQAWAVAWAGSPLFHDPIEARNNGPVIPTIQSSTGGLKTEVVEYSLSVDGNTADIVEAVLAHYAESPLEELLCRVQVEGPLLRARGSDSQDRDNRGVIDVGDMRRFYCELAVSGKEVPAAPILSENSNAGREQLFRALLRDQQSQWAETLTWLEIR